MVEVIHRCLIVQYSMIDGHQHLWVLVWHIV